MLWLLRRWVQWAPGAFVAGLVFGFAPFALVNLAVAHLNTEWLAWCRSWWVVSTSCWSANGDARWWWAWLSVSSSWSSSS